MTDKNNYISPRKSDLVKIKISEIDAPLPDLKNTTYSCAITVGKWIASWIVSALEEGKININNILPSKPEFAYKLGVSIGTVQNAIRYIEDLGYVESKQCLGTLVKDYRNAGTTIRKLTSKRDIAIDAIKRYIVSDGFSIGSKLPSAITISTIIGHTQNTTRLALDALTSQGILEKTFKTVKECHWIVKSKDFETSLPNSATKQETLVDMVVKDLENYITTNLKVGDKMPAHGELVTILKASMKTIHDALQILINQGILLSRRGRYGTTVVKMPGVSILSSKPETSIFAPAQDAAFYHYERTQNYIKRLIASEYNVGDKLPSISELATRLDLSQNTIRKAFHNLSEEGYLVFSRGRYGGTFVIDIPEVETQAFKWLAVNPAYAKDFQPDSN